MTPERREQLKSLTIGTCGHGCERWQENLKEAMAEVEHLTALMGVRIRERDACRECSRDHASFVDQTHDQHRAIKKICQKLANMGVNPETHALANRVLAILTPEGAHAAVVAATEPFPLPPQDDHSLAALINEQ